MYDDYKRMLEVRKERQNMSETGNKSVTSKPKKPSYQDRNKTLKDIGFSSYDAYLRSPLWNGIKSRVFVQKGRRCYICGSRADIIHHRGYGRDTLEGTNFDPLIPLCDGCHQKIEFRKNGIKRSLYDVDKHFNSLIRKKNKRRKKDIKHARKHNVVVPKPESGYLPGQCQECGQIARKNTQYCRPCAKAKGIVIVVICPICGDAPKMEDNKGCKTCVSRLLSRGELQLNKRERRSKRREEQRVQVVEMCQWLKNRKK